MLAHHAVLKNKRCQLMLNITLKMLHYNEYFKEKFNILNNKIKYLHCMKQFIFYKPIKLKIIENSKISTILKSMSYAIELFRFCY